MISRHANAYAKLAFFPNTFGCKMSSRQKYDIFFGNLLRHNPCHRTRSMKLARTIADLAGCEEIGFVHLAEALQYRPKLMLSYHPCGLCPVRYARNLDIKR